MFEIKETDKKNYVSADAGPDCICSRCLKPIMEDPVIRAWPEEMDEYYKKGEPIPDEFNYEYNFHPECLGMNTIKTDEEQYKIDMEGL